MLEASPRKPCSGAQHVLEHGEIHGRFHTIIPREDFSKGGFTVFAFEADAEQDGPSEEIDLAGKSEGRAPRSKAGIQYAAAVMMERRRLLHSRIPIEMLVFTGSLPSRE